MTSFIETSPSGCTPCQEFDVSSNSSKSESSEIPFRPGASPRGWTQLVESDTPEVSNVAHGSEPESVPESRESNFPFLDDYPARPLTPSSPMSATSTAKSSAYTAYRELRNEISMIAQASLKRRQDEPHKSGADDNAELDVSDREHPSKRSRSLPSMNDEILKPLASQEERSPSMPRKYLTNEVPQEIVRTLRAWYLWETKEKNNVVEKFTLGSTKEVYQRAATRRRHGFQDLSRTIAQYTGPNHELLEVKPYVLQDVLPGLVDIPRRWVLVAQGAVSGPWIITFKCTNLNGSFQRIWRGIDGCEENLSIEKTWISCSRQHVQTCTSDSDKRTDSEEGQSSEYLPNEGSDSEKDQPAESLAIDRQMRPDPTRNVCLPDNLMRELKFYFQQQRQQKRDVIEEITSKNRDFVQRNGHIARFESSIDGTPLVAAYVSTADIPFLCQENCHPRRLNFVIDSHGNGFVVKWTGSKAGGSGITYYRKWRARQGFESQPSVRRLGKHHTTSTPEGYMRLSHDSCCQSHSQAVYTQASQAKENARESRMRDHTNSGAHKFHRLIASRAQQATESSVASPDHAILPTFLNTYRDSEPQINQRTISVLRDTTLSGSNGPLRCFPPTSLNAEPEVYFSFLCPTEGMRLVESFEVEHRKCDTLSGFKMELVKSHMFSIEEVMSGKSYLCMFLQQFPDRAFLMNGPDINEYNTIMQAIEDVKKTGTNQKIVMSVQRWN